MSGESKEAIPVSSSDLTFLVEALLHYERMIRPPIRSLTVVGQGRPSLSQSITILSRLAQTQTDSAQIPLSLWQEASALNYVNGHWACAAQIQLKVECLLTSAIWSYGHEAEVYIFLNLPFPSNLKENSSIRCILSTPEQNLL